MDKKNALLAAIAVLGIAGCGAGNGSNGEVGGRNKALVITTDYQDGSFSLIDLEDWSTHTGIRRIHPDAVCRYDPLTRTPFVISRLGADAVEVLDPEDGWSVANEYSVGSGSNPQDMAVVSAERAYVLRYAETGLLTVHPTLGSELGTVDLGQYADGDGVPEAAWALVHGDEVFVALQRLTDFVPADYSSLVVLDAASGEPKREIRLSAADPFAPLRYVPGLDRIAVVETGLVGELDGGLELLAPDAEGPAGLAVTEQQLGGDLMDAVVADEHHAYAVIAVEQQDKQMSTTLVGFNPATGESVTVLDEAEEFDHSFLSLEPGGERLWVTLRTRSTPGVRVYSTADGSELTAAPIDTGLPPFMICFVPGE